MIDPRQSPVAMLPTLNAVAGHMIAHHAPLRKINVEDTEQMIAEVSDALDVDPQQVEDELNFPLNFPQSLAFFEQTWAIGWKDDEKSPVSFLFRDCLAQTFLMALDAHIEESV